MSNGPKTPVTSDEYSYYKNIVAKNLNRVRTKYGKTQANIADYLGLTPSGYGDYERGRAPEVDKLYALAAYYEISVSEFFIDYDNKGNPLNAEMLKDPTDKPMINLADSIKAIADSMNSLANLRQLEERIARLEALVGQRN